MSLLYKPDWEEARQRYEAWWAGEYFGRCMLTVTAPRADGPSEPMPPAPEDPEAKWTDLEYWARWNEWNLRRTFFGGEALPTWHFGYPGRENIPVFLGCPVTLAETTGWVDPILHGEHLDVAGLQIDPENRWWKFAQQALEFGAEQCRGKALLSIGAFGGCGDTLAWLRSTQQLLYDVAERPDQVRAAELYLMDLWCQVYDRFLAITGKAADGSTCWFQLWSPGKFYATHCDFAYMISPQAFREIFLPAIEREVKFLDHAVHHVDGIGNFAHVDALCRLPRLQAIQILPGAGKPSPLHYMDLLRKVQAAGKNLHISLEPDEVPDALEFLSARGLCIETTCRTEAEARLLLKEVTKRSRDRKPPG